MLFCVGTAAEEVKIGESKEEIKKKVENEKEQITCEMEKVKKVKEKKKERERRDKVDGPSCCLAAGVLWACII